MRTPEEMAINAIVFPISNGLDHESVQEMGGYEALAETCHKLDQDFMDRAVDEGNPKMLSRSVFFYYLGRYFDYCHQLELASRKHLENL